MISRSISYSKQVMILKNDFQRLLFTWTVPHLDDFGKIQGDPQILKAIVMPLSQNSISEFEDAIQSMIEAKLIERYEVDGEQIIEFLGFDKHQSGLHKRTISKFPENPKNSGKFPEIPGSSVSNEANRNEENRIANITEESSQLVDPITFLPKNEGENAALEAYKALEPNNPSSFLTTYYSAYLKKLPPSLFFQFVSEIKQDPNIKNRGAIFNTKVKEYFKKRREK